jgi:hypothetical protein
MEKNKKFPADPAKRLKSEKKWREKKLASMAYEKKTPEILQFLRFILKFIKSLVLKH